MAGKPRIYRPWFADAARLMATTACSLPAAANELGFELTARDLKSIYRCRAWITCLAEARERVLVGPTAELKSGRYLKKRWDKLDAYNRQFRKPATHAEVSSPMGPCAERPAQPAYPEPIRFNLEFCPHCGAKSGQR
jgi:hypothetical protein